MFNKHCLLVCATVAAIAAFSQSLSTVRIPHTRFTCQGRAAGYYADLDTGCQVYHMCDGLGRQFSYTCPNTTLFQQRMLICDHWYMVNCSNSESDYSANLLIGQRDKPFVSEAEMRQRTPRPDILTVPLNSNYFEGQKEAESRYPVHPGNSVVGVADSISNVNNNGLDVAKPNYRPPTSWSTGTSVNRPNKVWGQHNLNEEDNLAASASQAPEPTYQPTPGNKDFMQNTAVPSVSPPSQELVPPFQPITTTTESYNSDEFTIDARMKPANEDRVFNFIKRFDPNSPDSINTSMTKEEIESINKELPAGQSSAEEERIPRRNKNTGNNFNFVRSDSKNTSDKNKFNFEKGSSTEPTPAGDINTNAIPEPSKDLLPPKKDFSDILITTMGPPIYYEWKWAVPAFGLEPPKLDSSTNATSNVGQNRKLSGKNPFDSVTRPTTTTVDPTPSNTEYNISSYLVPDYIFPLDKPHPGYENDNAETSFQVKVGRQGRANYGENPACPQCHPAYVEPGTCEPCIVNR